MAASRWKRFAFFERNNLTFPSEVMTDLIPTISNESGRLTLSVDEGDTVSMVVSTALLPNMMGKVTEKKMDGKRNDDDESKSIEAMMRAIAACSAPPVQDGTIQLPSQAQTFLDSKSTTAQDDGLVLVFCASQQSDRVHCIDVTVRCHPSARNSADGTNAPAATPDDSLDGWRGYWTPFVNQPTEKLPDKVEDRIMSDHMPPPAGDPVVDLAACRQHDHLWVACLASTNLIVFVDPHLSLSCRLPLATNTAEEGVSYRLGTSWNVPQQQKYNCVDISSNGLIAVGTDNGSVHVFNPQKGFLRNIMSFSSRESLITSVRWSVSPSKVALFCCHQSLRSSRNGGGGICCYDLGNPNDPSTTPLARHDLDSRPVLSSRLCDDGLLVARSDGIYTYSHSQKVAVSPIDGIKLAICAVPTHQAIPANSSNGDASIAATATLSSYALVASTDSKSGRDAVDIYDANNKLVAFHVLLSPSHKALQAVGVMVANRSSAIVLTSGGALVTLTEKITSEKVSLLTQKNLYSAAISMAYADPSYQPSEIMALYRRHAEHLYRKGSFSEAMDQYIYTIGSLESSHVIFRYLDAPRIPMLVKYLEELRRRELATAVHNELLRTCYLKLGDDEAAERIATPSEDANSCASIVASLTHNPKDALAMVCSFEAPQAAEALVTYGAALARTLPRETAGVVVSLCLGTYSPSAMATAAAHEVSRMLEYPTNEQDRRCTPYPVHLFASSFLENPKMLRLILAHCNRNKCPLTPTLRRTLLELTLAEWNNAKRSGDTEAEKLRRKEAITALTDAHCRDIGDYDALVLVQLAGFSEGELLLYERLQMVPMLLSRYAQDGGDRARRQMLAMCRNDPQVLADVLGHFVNIASEKVSSEDNNVGNDGESINSQAEEILEDIREALAMARSQGVLPPVRIARILAGEGTGQFCDTAKADTNKRTVPLSVALDYVGEILDESRGKISDLQGEVEEYNRLCNSMEVEIEALLNGQQNEHDTDIIEKRDTLDIDSLYTRLQASLDEGPKLENKTAQSREEFWRDMNQSDDSFETISRYFAKGLIA